MYLVLYEDMNHALFKEIPQEVKDAFDNGYVLNIYDVGAGPVRDLQSNGKFEEIPVEE